MTKRTTKKSRFAQIAILLTLLGGWSNGASSAWAQVAGFASSRQEAPARAESGSGVRDFVSNLNPFKPKESAESANVVPQGPARVSFANVPATRPTSLPSAEQERAALIGRRSNWGAAPLPGSASAAPAAVAPAPRSGAAPVAVAPAPRSGAASTETRTFGTTRAAVASLNPSSRTSTLGASTAKKSSTGGVAALLLDELEEEIGDAPIASSADARISTARRSASANGERRSLRGEGGLGSLELLEESLLEEAADASEDWSESATRVSVDDEGEGEGEKTSSRKASRKTASRSAKKPAARASVAQDDELVGPAIPVFSTEPEVAEESSDWEDDALLADAETSEEYADYANDENGENSENGGDLNDSEVWGSAENEEETEDEDARLSLVASDSSERSDKGASSRRANVAKRAEKPRKTEEAEETDGLGEEAALDELDDRFGAFFQDGSQLQVNAETATAASSESASTASRTNANGGAWRVAEAKEEEETIVSSRSPIVEIETIGPKNLVVGQESTFKVRARNVGSVAARKLVVTTELPETVAVGAVEAKIGDAQIKTRDVGFDGESRRCVWEVGTLAAGASAELELTMTPQKRSAFELVSRFECERASARTGVEVVEPILEARVEGRDEIEWGVEDKYRLRLRNVGNGDAQDVELFVSTGETNATQRIGVLKAGEEKSIEMAVKTVLDDSISIDVRANGAYGVEARATKKIAVLRGKLDVAVEAPELQFVDGEFEALVRVKNVGDAPLENVDVAAQIPASVEILACDGSARRNAEKGRVYWTVPLVRPNEEIVFKTLCRLTETGDATFAVVGADQTGLTAQSETTVQVESIAVLAMRVNAPKDPVAVGKECVYELVIENNGTKDAAEIESGVFLGVGLKPIAVEGGLGTVSEAESKVIFRKIETLPAGERVVFRVRAQAVDAGNHKVQAMLQSIPEEARLMSEEMTYCYERPANRRQLDKTPSMVALEPSETDATTRR